jgi:putative toxin-antitoxin system antitoxin component (TIGR02293 family)
METKISAYPTQQYLGQNYLVQDAAATYETPKYKRIHLIRKGLPFSALAHFLKTSGLSQLELAIIFQVSTRTVQRYSPQQNLPPQVSEKLLALNDLYQQAGLALAGSPQNITQWLRKPLAALGNLAPLSLLDTFEGLQEVKVILGRLEWGVYS